MRWMIKNCWINQLVGVQIIFRWVLDQQLHWSRSHAVNDHRFCQLIGGQHLPLRWATPPVHDGRANRAVSYRKKVENSMDLHRIQRLSGKSYIKLRKFISSDGSVLARHAFGAPIVVTPDWMAAWRSLGPRKLVPRVRNDDAWSCVIWLNSVRK